VRLQQIIKPRRPDSFFQGDAQITSQPDKELHNGAGLGFDDGFHQQFPGAIHHRNGNRFFVNIHPDILDASYRFGSLGGKVVLTLRTFPQGLTATVPSPQLAKPY
jgi:hypothetical protein